MDWLLIFAVFSQIPLGQLPDVATKAVNDDIAYTSDIAVLSDLEFGRNLPRGYSVILAKSKPDGDSGTDPAGRRLRGKLEVLATIVGESVRGPIQFDFERPRSVRFIERSHGVEPFIAGEDRVIVITIKPSAAQPLVIESVIYLPDGWDKFVVPLREFHAKHVDLSDPTKVAAARLELETKLRDDNPLIAIAAARMLITAGLWNEALTTGPLASARGIKQGVLAWLLLKSTKPASPDAIAEQLAKIVDGTDGLAKVQGIAIAAKLGHSEVKLRRIGSPSRLIFKALAKKLEQSPTKTDEDRYMKYILDSSVPWVLPVGG